VNLCIDHLQCSLEPRILQAQASARPELLVSLRAVSRHSPDGLPLGHLETSLLPGRREFQGKIASLASAGHRLCALHPTSLDAGLPASLCIQLCGLSSFSSGDHDADTQWRKSKRPSRSGYAKSRIMQRGVGFYLLGSPLDKVREDMGIGSYRRISQRSAAKALI
jgi:hypothetical protein